MAELTTFEDTMQQLRQEMIEPLTRQRDAANQREAELVEELGKVRAGRRDLDRMLKALEPSLKPGPKQNGRVKGRAKPGSPVKPELLDAATAFLRTADFPNGFTQTSAEKAYREAKLEPRMSNPTWGNIVDALHETGVIRFDHVGKRGGRVFKVVGK